MMDIFEFVTGPGEGGFSRGPGGGDRSEYRRAGGRKYLNFTPSTMSISKYMYIRDD